MFEIVVEWVYLVWLLLHHPIIKWWSTTAKYGTPRGPDSSTVSNHDKWLLECHESKTFLNGQNLYFSLSSSSSSSSPPSESQWQIGFRVNNSATGCMGASLRDFYMYKSPIWWKGQAHMTSTRWLIWSLPLDPLYSFIDLPLTSPLSFLSSSYQSCASSSILSSSAALLLLLLLCDRS